MSSFFLKKIDIVSQDVEKLLDKKKSLIRELLILSFLIAVFSLTMPVYMMNLYERVLSSRSPETLFTLTFLAVGFISLQIILENIRSREARVFGDYFDETVRARVVKFLAEMLKYKKIEQPLQAVDEVRNFFHSNSPITLMEIPYIPIYMIFLYVLHPTLGLLATFSCLCILYFGHQSESQTKKQLMVDKRTRAQTLIQTDEFFRKHSYLQSLGIEDIYLNKWVKSHADLNAIEHQAAEKYQKLSNKIKSIFYMTQVLGLGLAALLVVLDQTTAGVLFISNMLISKCIGPMQQLGPALAAFKNFDAAWANVVGFLNAPVKDISDRLSIGVANKSLRFDSVFIKHPGSSHEIFKNFVCDAKPSDVIGIFGHSGSGKSSLIKCPIENSLISRGKIFLDEIELGHWSSQDLRASISYVPSHGGVIGNTSVIDNLTNMTGDEVVAVELAKKFGIEKSIIQLKNGFHTEIYDDFPLLSASEKKLIALARAYSIKPFILLLDEPSLNLDLPAQIKLRELINEYTQLGKVVIVSSNDPRVLEKCTKIYEIENGKIKNLINKK